MAFLFCFVFTMGGVVDVELRAVSGGTAGSHGYRLQNTRDVSAGGCGAAAQVGCAG